MQMRTWMRVGCALLGTLALSLARASVGLAEIDGTADHGLVTVFYPSSGEAKGVTRGPFSLEVAWQGPPVRGNGHLVVISHGSGASPWVYADLARTLVQAGFTVALPEHAGDNAKDGQSPGPESWKQRPREVSRAIDAIGQDSRWASLLSLDGVGVYGMSAGGHTALTLAGGRWSPAQLRAHCDAHIQEDFQTCVGLITRLTGGVLDGLKKRVALWVIDRRFTDSHWYSHTDPRISAVVAGVPLAADFDMASLVAPRVPLGLVTAQQDKWLIPVYHSDRVVQVCRPCERVADLPTGGHGALLSPLPPGRSGLLADLIDDPAGFDRARTVPELNRKITDFFVRRLLPREGNGAVGR